MISLSLSKLSLCARVCMHIFVPVLVYMCGGLSDDWEGLEGEKVKRCVSSLSLCVEEGVRCEGGGPQVKSKSLKVETVQFQCVCMCRARSSLLEATASYRPSHHPLVTRRRCSLLSPFHRSPVT